MSEGLKLLREIGAQTIHNDTHISREYVQAIIHESFEGLQSVQFVGFVSILEREYGVDLSDLLSKGRAHFNEEDEKNGEIQKVFVVPKRKKSYAKVYTWLGIILFISFVYYSFVYVNSVLPDVETVDNTQIENATKNIEQEVKVEEVEIEVTSQETNTTEEATKENLELETTVEEEVIVVEPEPVATPRSLKILPKRKIWAGYINIKTNQKYQKVFRKEFALDTDKDWLLLFGAGTVKLEVNEKNEKFSSNQNMRFKYVDGVFTKISVTEFKSLNKGRKW